MSTLTPPSSRRGSRSRSDARTAQRATRTGRTGGGSARAWDHSRQMDGGLSERSAVAMQTRTDSYDGSFNDGATSGRLTSDVRPLSTGRTGWGSRSIGADSRTDGRSQRRAGGIARTQRSQRSAARARMGSRQVISVRGRLTEDSTARRNGSTLNFVIIVLLLAAVGVGLTMYFSGMSTEQSFRISEARAEQKALTAELETLNRDALRESSDAAVAKKAAALGMVVPDQPGIITVDSDGSVTEKRAADAAKVHNVKDITVSDAAVASSSAAASASAAPSAAASATPSVAPSAAASAAPSTAASGQASAAPTTASVPTPEQVANADTPR